VAADLFQNCHPIVHLRHCRVHYHLYLSQIKMSSNTWKISASSTLLHKARDVDAIIPTSTEPPGRD
jgi:hypothetical protein